MSQRVRLKGNKKHIELDKNGKMTYQNMWNVIKTVLREKFIALSASIRIEKRSPANKPLPSKARREKIEQAKLEKCKIGRFMSTS